MADEVLNVLPTDAFVEILLRLPTSARRRFRLVCRRWRDAIDERTPERQVRTKILAFISQRQSSRAIVLDDKDGHRMHEWTYNSNTRDGDVHMVGTCNGLICLQDTGERAFFPISVANPVTGEEKVLPSLPTTWDSFGQLGMYGFGYHPVTGQYKVVHVPSHRAHWRDVAHVLTLGGSPSWREVVSPTLSRSFNPECGIVGVDGSVYWFSLSADRVMALDLEDERVTSFQGPPGVRPVKTMDEASWKVTSVHARLGVAVPRYEASAMTVEVWVLDGGGRKRPRSRRYCLDDCGKPPRWSRRYCLRDSGRMIVLTPHLTHGEYVVSMSCSGKRSYRRKLDGGRGGTDDGDGRDVPLELSEGAELIMTGEIERSLSTFAYVETREPVPRALSSGG